MKYTLRPQELTPGGRLWHREIDCRTDQHGARNLQKTWWNPNQRLLAVTALPAKAQRENTICSRIFLKDPKSDRSSLQTKFTRSHTPRDQVRKNLSADNKSLQGRRRIAEQSEACNCCTWSCVALIRCNILFVPLSVRCSSANRTHAQPWKICRLRSCSGLSLERSCVWATL